MIDKAIVIAMESIDYILTQYPKDDRGAIGGYMNSLAKSYGVLIQLQAFLADVEHEQKSGYDKTKPCPCPKCDPVAKDDRIHFEQCIKEALVDTLNDESSQCGATPPTSEKSDTAETPLNTSATETPASCVA